jgi:hypothetical protein
MTRHHHGSDTSLQSTPVRKIALVYPSATGHAIVHTVLTLHRRFRDVRSGTERVDDPGLGTAGRSRS